MLKWPTANSAIDPLEIFMRRKRRAIVMQTNQWSIVSFPLRRMMIDLNAATRKSPCCVCARFESIFCYFSSWIWSTRVEQSAGNHHLPWIRANCQKTTCHIMKLDRLESGTNDTYSVYQMFEQRYIWCGPSSCPPLGSFLFHSESLALQHESAV